MPSVETDALSQIRLFQGLTPEQLDKVSESVQQVVLPAGASVVRAEDLGRVVYVLVQGTVKVHALQLDGSDVILAFLGPGDTIGEMSVIDSLGHSADVVTMEESRLLSIERTRFQAHLREMPQMSANLVQLLSERLRQANETIQALSCLDVAGRVSRQILTFASRYGRPLGDDRFAIPLRLTQTDLASLVGASRERVNQVMMELKQAGAVEVSRGHQITVLDRRELAARCA